MERVALKHRKMYMRVAHAVSESGTCDRAKVGAVLVKNGCIIGTGYNGSARGDEHCSDVGHLMRDNHCVRTIHAEENAIINAAKNGVSTIGAVMICTHKPCLRCCQRAINAGVEAIYYDVDYGVKDKDRDKLLDRAGIRVVYFN